MSNIQIHLVFQKPDFFTSEPILEQLRQFANLGFSPSLQQLFSDHKMVTPKDSDRGEEYLQSLNQMITCLEHFGTTTKIDTMKAREQYSSFAYYWRVNSTYKERIQKQLGEDERPLEMSELSQKGLHLLSNVTTRAALFKVKIIALRDQQLQAQALSCEKEAQSLLQQAKESLAAIQGIAKIALTRHDAVEEQIQSIEKEITTIERLQAAFESLKLHSALQQCQDTVIKQQISHLIDGIKALQEEVGATHQQAQQALRKVMEHGELIQKKVVVEPTPLTPPEDLSQDSDNNPEAVLVVEKEPTPEEVFQGLGNENDGQAFQPNLNPDANEDTLKRKEANQQRLTRLITLVRNYKTMLDAEKNVGVTRFFHPSRKETKINYCAELLTQLEKIDITADSSLQELVNKAHDQAKKNVGASPLLTAGGSYFGTSRMLAMQRLLGIEEAWTAGRSSFIFLNTQSDFHGLKATGIVEKVKSVVGDFFTETRDTTDAFDALCEKVAPKPSPLSEIKAAAQ